MAFATNLFNEFESEELVNLYFKRWKIEEGYHVLKNKFRFESATGEATIYVYQDFWSQILVYNMVQDILNSTKEIHSKRTETHEYKYHVHANTLHIDNAMDMKGFLKIQIKINGI